MTDIATLLQNMKRALDPESQPSPTPRPTMPGDMRMLLSNAANTGRLKLRSGAMSALGIDESPLKRLSDFHSGHGAYATDRDKRVHKSASQQLTSGLGKVLGPAGAAQAADALGLVNESLSGYTGMAAGHPFESPSGFDYEDIASNREGQNEALAKGAGVDPTSAQFLASNIPLLGAPAFWELVGRSRPRN